MNASKGEAKGPATKTEKKAEKQADLQTAYEIHTIAQLVHGHLAMACPWATPVTVPDGYPGPGIGSFPNPSMPQGTTSAPPVWALRSPWPW